MTYIILISLTIKYIKNWRQTQKIREITYEDQGEGVRDVGCVAECVEESEKEKKRTGMLWNESGRNGSGLLKKKSIKKSQKWR